MPFRVELVKGEEKKDGAIYSYFCAGTMACAGSEFPIVFRVNRNSNDEMVEVILSIDCHEADLPTTLPCLQVFAAAHGGNVWATIESGKDLPKKHHILLLFLQRLSTLNICMRKAEDMLDQLENYLMNRGSIAVLANRCGNN